MRVEEFDFDLPDDRIALRPVAPRDSAKLLVVTPPRDFSDRLVTDLPRLLHPDDLLIFNDTRVVPAALEGHRLGRGQNEPRIETLLLERIDGSRWKALAKPGKRLKPGDRIRFGGPENLCLLGAVEATVESKLHDGEIVLAFDFSGPVLDESIKTVGHIPLPPYITAKRLPDDRDRDDYQTIFAREDGAVAAPTAGLHFTPELIERLKGHGVSIAFVTLHVGAGTFLPVRSEEVSQHKMQAERGTISVETAAQITRAKRQGQRVVCVGTTALRLVESASQPGGQISAFDSETTLFITPGYQFRTVDALITNFHLPRSTLFMLVAAFSGLETMKAAYAHAINRRYRFYSYGDACLLFPSHT